MVWLRIEDLNEDTGPGGGVGLAHDVFNVFLDGLFGDLKRIRNFLVCPPFGQMLDHRLFTIGQRELFLGLIRVQLLPATEFL